MPEHTDNLHQEMSESRDDVITIVLTADNHLGYTAFGQQPRKREELQRRLREAFEQATNFAVAQGVDLFLQAGDWFDSTAPDERDRSFVAVRLAQFKQRGVQTVVLGGVRDTAVSGHSLHSETTPSPQQSFARLGALHYLPPVQPDPTQPLEPLQLSIRGIPVALCGLGVLAGQEGDPLARVEVSSKVDDVALSILLLHAPIEGLADGSTLLDTRAQVRRETIEQQPYFPYILAGYHHSFNHQRIGQTEVVVAGATQYIDASPQTSAPGFVFLGLAADGLRWCRHIAVDALTLQRLVLHTSELWSSDAEATATASDTPTATILERLRPLCQADTLLQLCLEGELTRRQYHELDLNQIRRYGEEHCFALAIDDSSLSLLPEQNAVSAETGERFSPREELIAVAQEWMAATTNKREKRAFQMAKEELLLAMDNVQDKQ